MNRLSIAFVVLLAFSTIFLAQSGKPGLTIHELEQQDQKDQQIEHAQLRFPERYWQRELEVKRLMQNGGVHSPQDFFDVGVVLTHSHDASNQLLAHLAFTAAAFGGIIEAKHYAATALDRYLIDSNQTPAFGTIFWVPADREYRHDVSPAMNDAIRAAFCVPPRQQLDRAYEQEKKGIDSYDGTHDSFWDYKREGCH